MGVYMVTEKLVGSRTVGVAAGETIYGGNLVGLNAAGFATQAAADSERVIGVAEKTIDNTDGADGAVSVSITTGCFAYENDGTTPCTDLTLVGKIVDSTTIAEFDPDTDTTTAVVDVRYVDAKGKVVVDLR